MKKILTVRNTFTGVKLSDCAEFCSCTVELCFLNHLEQNIKHLYNLRVWKYNVSVPRGRGHSCPTPALLGLGCLSPESLQTKPQLVSGGRDSLSAHT